MRTNFTVNPVDELLFQAVLDGNKAQVELILTRYQGNVNAQNRYGASPALLAAKRNDLSIMEYLISKGADLSVGDHLGQTAMSWAEHNRNNVMIECIAESLRSHSNSSPK